MARGPCECECAVRWSVECECTLHTAHNTLHTATSASASASARASAHCTVHTTHCTPRQVRVRVHSAMVSASRWTNEKKKLANIPAERVAGENIP
eukprot:3437642-Pyramimonas_sp.AAC.1